MADLWLVSESKWKREDGPSSPRPGGRNDVFFSPIELQRCSHELRRTLLVDSGLVTDEKPVPVYGIVASSCHQLSAGGQEANGPRLQTWYGGQAMGCGACRRIHSRSINVLSREICSS